MLLNGRSAQRFDALVSAAADLHAVVQEIAGATVLDLGIAVPGGLEAGVQLAQLCLADLATVALVNGDTAMWEGPAVAVRTDHPVAACLASQYAGWQLAHGKFFALGSGAMRAAGSKEPLFNDIGLRELATRVVGILETRKLPPPEIVEQIALACNVESRKVCLAVAPTASLAGSVQVVARSIETALHKLHELHFDVERVVSGWGVAPLPPIAKDDLAAIGRTNDAILYGGDVTLYVRGDDDSLSQLGPQVPSNASSDYGQPFGEIFRHYNYDFYKIDPLLFSPARITFMNLDTGHTHRFGKLNPALVHMSFTS